MPKSRRTAKRKPKLYSEERRESIDWHNRTDRPQINGSVLEEDLVASEGWFAFVPPGTSDEIHLKLRAQASPYDAIQEWFLLQRLAEVQESETFSLDRVLPFWNYGLDPKIERQPCGAFHLAGTRTVSWSYMVDAHSVWARSGWREVRPPDLLALLDPDSRLPFMSDPGPDHVASEDRWLQVAIDMARPLEDQFKVAKKTCRKLQDITFALAGQKKPRPGKRETHRKVWIYTLHYSAGLTTPQIAEEVFPKEKQSEAQFKVKACLREVSDAIRKAGFEPPKFGGQSKPSG